MADLNKYWNTLLKIEGEYVERSSEPGGAGKYGITLQSFQAYGADLNRDGVITKEDLRLMDPPMAKQIYYKHYWVPMLGPQLSDQKVAEIIFDHGVNAGVSRASRMVRLTLHQLGQKKTKISSDPLTTEDLNSIERVNPVKFYNAYRDLRIVYYRWIANDLSPKLSLARMLNSLGTPNRNNRQYLAGWLSRVNTHFPKRSKLENGTNQAGTMIIGSELAVTLAAAAGLLWWGSTRLKSKTKRASN